MVNIKKKYFNLVSNEIKIDNPFYSHKDTKKLNMIKIIEEIKHDKTLSISFEPEIFAAIVIRNVDRAYPTAILFHTGSYTLLGGKMENAIFVYTFLSNLIKKYTF